jgi:GTP cyclohydrolase II
MVQRYLGDPPSDGQVIASRSQAVTLAITFTQLGFESEERRYIVAGEILHRLKITQIRLLTNNPGKRAALDSPQQGLFAHEGRAGRP